MVFEKKEKEEEEDKSITRACLFQVYVHILWILTPLSQPAAFSKNAKDALEYVCSSFSKS